MRGQRSVAAVAAVVVMFSIGAATSDAPGARAGGRYRISSERVAPGVRLIRMTDRRGPNRIRVLKIAPWSPLTLEFELANDLIPGHEKISSMAARNGAVAAINGDYTLLPSHPQAGRPVHMFAQNAELVTSPLVYGRGFAMSSDEQSFFFGHPKDRAWLTQADTGEPWKIDGWNELPVASGQLGVFTMAGGRNHKPPRNACSARLLPTATPALSPEGTSVQQSFTVDVTRCAADRLNRRGGVVVSAWWGSLQGAQIETGLLPGESVTLDWTTGWVGVDETIGGNPTLLEQGVNTIGECPATSMFCKRNPRTGIGVDGSGRLLLVTVDGRQKGSVGMTLDQFAELFRFLGATSALNLDGGGSTTMWVRGRVVNRISDPTERAVGSAILVVRAPSGSPPAPAATPSPSPTPSPTPTPESQSQTRIQSVNVAEKSGDEIRCLTLLDPGSTGGLLDYLARQRPGAFSEPLLRHALQIYRGQRDCTLASSTRS